MDDKALHKITYGLFLLTACENGKDNGCIINTAIQVANTPTQICIAVNKANKRAMTAVTVTRIISMKQDPFLCFAIKLMIKSILFINISLRIEHYLFKVNMIAWEFITILKKPRILLMTVHFSEYNGDPFALYLICAMQKNIFVL